MGLHFKATPTTGLVNPPASAAETAVFITPVLPAVGPAEAPGSNPVGISGTINITPGTGNTAIVIRIRQGSGVNGTVVGPVQTHTVAAAAPQSISFGATDATGYLQGGGQYTITISATGATGAGTTNFVDVEVLT